MADFEVNMILLLSTLATITAIAALFNACKPIRVAVRVRNRK
jgi:hypothetical protein